MVEFADFDHGPMETPMTDTSMPLIELLQKQDDGDFLRAVTEGVRQTPRLAVVGVAFRHRGRSGRDVCNRPAGAATGLCRVRRV